MRIFDLHNDALTADGVSDRENVIYAVWTSQLTAKKTVEIFNNNRNKLLAVEDCGCFDEFDALIKLKPLYVGLTWNYSNRYAGGVLSNDGLTSLGRQAVSILNENNMVLDVAHLNSKSFSEVVSIADKIICSHTCFESVNSHIRNLTRSQVSDIISKGGIIGLCFVTEFLGGNTIKEILRHIDWFLSVFGDDNLCIGSDFYGTVNLPVNMADYMDICNLVSAMIYNGYSDCTISKILYGNAAAYFKREVKDERFV